MSQMVNMVIDCCQNAPFSLDHPILFKCHHMGKILQIVFKTSNYVINSNKNMGKLET